jgi:tetratricopeptide (TPR) repeat protein
MRLLPVALVLAFGFATMSTSVSGQRADDQISPLSLSYQARGDALTAGGEYPAAIDALETALAVDPRNRGAYRSLARVAYAQGLYGKAIKLYGEVLAIEPNDLVALAGQGEAMVQRGAVDRARANLERIKMLCTTGCAPSVQLSAAIAKGPPPAVVTAEVKPVAPSTVPKTP